MKILSNDEIASGLGKNWRSSQFFELGYAFDRSKGEESQRTISMAVRQRFLSFVTPRRLNKTERPLLDVLIATFKRGSGVSSLETALRDYFEGGGTRGDAVRFFSEVSRAYGRFHMVIDKKTKHSEETTPETLRLAAARHGLAGATFPIPAVCMLGKIALEGMHKDETNG